LLIKTLNPEAFPPKLKTASLNPVCKQLNCLGDQTLLQRKLVAIVGSRKASQEELEFAFKLASELAERGLSTVSGIALGIDAQAHQGSLAKDGQTISVLGCGIKKFYPSENKKLARQIINNKGLIISEYDNDQEIQTWQLINRNRLIIALADAVVIVTTGQSGGTMYSARDCFRYHKPLFIPQHLGGQGGQILLSRPSKNLPDLIKQFKLTVAEKRHLTEQPLAQPFDIDCLLELTQ
jgi:DNA processing protein